MKKVLLVSTVASMIGQFNMDNINILLKNGYEVDVACNFKDTSVWTEKRINIFIQQLANLNITYYQIDFTRNINKFDKHIKAYMQLKKLLSYKKYTFIHCHTPIAGVIGRLASYKVGIRVIYTAHGFHFFRGASIKDWLIYYPIEKILSMITDVLVTINHEDYKIASKNFFAKKVVYIPGVGIDIKKFSIVKISGEAKRKELGILNNGIILLSVGELSSRKNHEIVIKALGKLSDSNIYYVICGQGKLYDDLKMLSIKLNIEKNILLLGFRQDINEICLASDIYVFPSQREGLGIAALEGMASGLPLICSYVNGIKDYTEMGKTGFCLKPFDVDGYAKAIKELAYNQEKRRLMGKYNLKVVEKFDIKCVNEIMTNVYTDMQI